MMSTIAIQDDANPGLNAIGGLSRDQLIEKWKASYKRQPPKGISKLLLERSATHQAQVDVLGGLSITTKRALRAARTFGKKPRTTPNSRVELPVLTSGMRLVREWNGQTFSVDVIDGGFVWNGRVYRSLSAIARNITGTRWSGPRFFGL